MAWADVLGVMGKPDSLDETRTRYGTMDVMHYGGATIVVEDGRVVAVNQ